MEGFRRASFSLTELRFCCVMRLEGYGQEVSLDVLLSESPRQVVRIAYRTRAAVCKSETASTTLAFLEPFTAVW